MNKKYLITVNRSIYDMEQACENRETLVWVDTGRLEKGDKVYLVAVGGGEQAEVFGKATVGISQSFHSKEDVPGFAEGRWDDEWIGGLLARPDGVNWRILDDVEMAASTVPIEDGRFTDKKFRGRMKGLTALSKRDSEEMEKCFVSPAEVASAFRAYLHNISY